MLQIKTPLITNFYMSSNKIQLFLIRRYYICGETDWNVSKRLQGQTNNSNLTENGIKQSNDLKKKIEELSPDLIFSSPMKRAVNTAKIVFPNKEFSLIID